VTIAADAEVPFKGFLIQARSSLSNEAVGNFDPTTESQSIDCFSSVGVKHIFWEFSSQI
jgi:hypothetical protein